MAVVNDRCRPDKCALECANNCPVNRVGKKCIVATKQKKRAQISERHCIGCDICVKRCPFDAIRITKLPTSLENECSYRYGQNCFKLHRLPMPRLGQVLGLVGENGIGKSTALNIISGKYKPNFGDYRPEFEPKAEDIIQHYRGSDLQNYFISLYNNEEILVSHKIQYVDAINKTDKKESTIFELVEKYKTKVKADKPLYENSQAQRAHYEYILNTLELNHLLEKPLMNLSGGELQRFAIAFAGLSTVNYALIKDEKDAKKAAKKGIENVEQKKPKNYKMMYLFDEPSSYLDIQQRLTAAKVIRNLVEEKNDAYSIVVEHDLAVIDYLSDFCSVLYGEPGTFGVISLPLTVSNGINSFLAGEIRSENMKFRDDALKFRLIEATDGDDTEVVQKALMLNSAIEKNAANKSLEEMDEKKKNDNKDKNKIKTRFIEYPSMRVDFNTEDTQAFALNIEHGVFASSEIVLLLGQNGTGKTTFIKAIANKLPEFTKIDENDYTPLPDLPISFKPQTITPSFEGTVAELFRSRIRDSFNNQGFKDDVVRPLKILHLMDRTVKSLSGGELQRISLILALGKVAMLYLIDEPSAYLDASQRLIAAKVIKRFVMSAAKACFVVEHDFLMALYLADRVVNFDGNPGIEATAHKPCTVLTGLNNFLKIIGVTFRRDKESLRPRVNKLNSAKDKEQKASGQYFTNFFDTE